MNPGWCSTCGIRAAVFWSTVPAGVDLACRACRNVHGSSGAAASSRASRGLAPISRFACLSKMATQVWRSMAVRPMDSARVIRVLIVDDHPMVREGLRSMLSGEGVEVVAEAATAADAARTAEEARPDVVLLDVGLPDADGLTALAAIKA